MENVNITYKGETYIFPKNTTLYEVSKKFEKDYKHDILIGKINADMACLDEPIVEDAIVNFYDISSARGSKAYERSTILILVKAVKDIFNENVRVEHSIDKGIYCTIKGLTKGKLSQIETRMHEIVDKSYPIIRLNANRIKTIKYYEDNKEFDKAELLKYISNIGVTIYKLDNVFDYMYGEMLTNTSYVTDFKLEYLSDDGFVLMLPFRYDENKVNEYTHHEKLFNEINEYTEWSHRIGINNISDINKKLSKGNWNDLIFISEARQNNELFEIAKKIAKNHKIKVILIAGPSSSGKTTTSKKLKLFLESEGLKPFTLSVDDYFKERVETPLDEDGNRDYESLTAIDTKLFNNQLKDILDEKEVVLPTYNFITGEKEYKKKFKITKDGILIIEGLHSLNDELTSKIDNDSKYKIYISPLTCLNLDNHNRLNSTDNRLLRRIVRDNLRRGYTASDTLDSWKRVRLGETKYVFPFQDKADIVLNTSLIYEMSVLKVYAEPLLFSVKEDDPNYAEAIRLINILRMVLPMPAAYVPLDSILREFIGNSCFDE